MARYKVVEEMFTVIDGIKMRINNFNSFADIHYCKTWLDNLFYNDGTQMFKQMATEYQFT